MSTPTVTKDSAFRTWLGDDSIARSYVRSGANIGIADAIENSNAVNALSKDKKYPLLVNITEINSISKEARSYFAMNDRESNVTAFAIVIRSQVSKIIANFFFKLNHISVPARMFTNEESALKWLQKYQPQELNNE